MQALPANAARSCTHLTSTVAFRKGTTRNPSLQIQTAQLTRVKLTVKWQCELDVRCISGDRVLMNFILFTVFSLCICVCFLISRWVGVSIHKTCSPQSFEIQDLEAKISMTSSRLFGRLQLTTDGSIRLAKVGKRAKVEPSY